MDVIRDILFLGKENIQNNLLSNYLKKSLGYKCQRVDSKDLQSINVNKSSTTWLVLIDATGKSEANILEIIDSCEQFLPPAYIALINAEKDASCSKLILSAQVKGVFYGDATEENILHGLKEIIQGNYWIPRKIISKLLENIQITPELKPSRIAQLTNSEVKILKLISDGYSNNEIAEKLSLSIYTVKTHTYNLFKKLNVTNRVQATNIARKLACN